MITAATVVSAVVATAAEQDQQNDDPAPVTATKTVIAHIKYLRKKISRAFRAAHSMVFPAPENVQGANSNLSHSPCRDRPPGLS